MSDPKPVELLTEAEKVPLLQAYTEGPIAILDAVTAIVAAREAAARREALLEAADWMQECERWRNEAGAGNFDALVKRAEKAEAERDVERNAYLVAFGDRARHMDKVARVEALAEDLESGGYWPPWQALAAGRIRAALAEPERDEEGGR